MTAPKTHPKYEPPKVVTYREDEILKHMGPIGGCASGGYDPLCPDFQPAPMNPFGHRPERHHPGRSSRRYRSSLRSLYLDDDEDDI
jgi:hypothetical protein